MSYTTTDLVATIRTRAMLPDASTGSLGTASLLIMATEELHITLVPLILSAREHYYETYSDSVIAGDQNAYPLPVRAVGGVLSAVQYIAGTNVYTLPMIDPSQITTTNTSSTPSAYYIENNSLILFPTPATTTGTLRVRYFQRPSRLEQTINCAQIASIDALANTVTVASVPSTWTTGTIIDFVQQITPHRPYAIDQSITGVAGTTISFTSLPSGLIVGDWLALAEYTPIPEVPFEFLPVLAQMTVVKALEATSDHEGMQAAQAKLDAYMRAALMLMTPRNQSGVKKVMSNWRSW